MNKKGYKVGVYVGENNWSWKGGKPKCLDCGKSLAAYSSKRCQKCNGKAWSGENSNKWKGGLTELLWKNPAYRELQRRTRRHKTGYSKKYKSELGVSYTPEMQKVYRARRRDRFKLAGELTIKTVQLVYEDNIKKYGTLTCYLCEKPIEFKNDHLEHKTPLSRGGTNEYNNLGVSCAKCNQRKFTKTVEEFLADGK